MDPTLTESTGLTFTSLGLITLTKRYRMLLDRTKRPKSTRESERKTVSTDRHAVSNKVSPLFFTSRLFELKLFP